MEEKESNLPRWKSGSGWGRRAPEKTLTNWRGAVAGLAAPYNPPVLLWPQWTFGGVGGRTAGGAEEENVSLDCVGWWAHVRVSH